MRAFDKEYYTDIPYLGEEYTSLYNDQIKVFIINFFFYISSTVFSVRLKSRKTLLKDSTRKPCKNDNF